MKGLIFGDTLPVVYVLLKEFLSGLTHTGDALSLIEIIGTNWGKFIV